MAHRTAPLDTTGHPPGSDKIIANEVMERFAYYGMRTILAMVLIKYLPLDQLMTEQEASGVFHQFAAWNYFFPLAGALVADIWLGKYRTILWLSIVYTIGCVVLALDQTRTSVYLGLFLIALGSGGIKPSVVSYLGDQYGTRNMHLIDRAMAWFYRGINFGALLSTLATPILLAKYGPRIAFGIPAVGMALATVVFWSGRNQYAHIPPKGMAFIAELRAELKPLTKLVGLYFFMAAFFALYDQSGSEWVIQAAKMDLNFLGHEWLPSQIQVINPLLIVIFSGVIESKVFPLLKKIHPSDLVRVAFGFFLTTGSFAIVTWIQGHIEAGHIMNIGWQLVAYIILTAGEIFAYMSVLQLSYRKASPTMKSFVNSIFLLSVTAGNLFTSAINFGIQNNPPSFMPDTAGVYVLTLTARNTGSLEGTATVAITALGQSDYDDHLNHEKEKQKKSQLEFHGLAADAGHMKAVAPGAKDVPLYGDLDLGDVKGDATYQWTLRTAPAHSTVSITNPTRRLASFSPDVAGEYTFSFEATVGHLKSSGETRVIVKNEPQAPEANAGPAQTVLVGTNTTLNGSNSYDPNGGDLTYKWTMTSYPEGSTIRAINNDTIAGKGSWLKGSSFYLFFTVLMFLVSLAFIPFARAVDLGPDRVQGEAGSS